MQRPDLELSFDSLDVAIRSDGEDEQRETIVLEFDTGATLTAVELLPDSAIRIAAGILWKLPHARDRFEEVLANFRPKPPEPPKGA